MMKNRVLIVTGEMDPTADIMVACLTRRVVPFERLHPRDIPMRAQACMSFEMGRSPVGWVRGPGVHFAWDEVKSVWYRRPGRPALPLDLSLEEAEFALYETTDFISGLWRVIDALWVNHPDKNRVADCKPFQAVEAQRVGFTIPRTLFTNDPEVLRSFYDGLEGRVVYKTMTQGYLGVSSRQSIYTTKLSPTHLKRADLLVNAPGLFQEYLSKRCDLRITVIGRKVFAVEIHSQEDERGKQDWRRAEISTLKHVPHDLPGSIESQCLDLMHNLSLSYAAIDMILTPRGEYVFLEINPAGQFGWVERVTGLPLTETLADLLESAEG